VENGTDLFEETNDRFARESSAFIEPVRDSVHAPVHRLVLLPWSQMWVIYPEEFYGLRIPAFSTVYCDEMEDAVVPDSM
jgi:hypothetical protein